ncbi:PKD domain-containing protein [Paenibacillus sp. MBLB4367]|uniref:glycoside hydrolase family 78 protein n=1 Tax=Paenibacillus sp. MBLB4367 TaxID=3384767 RepID=UPI003907FA2C
MIIQWKGTVEQTKEIKVGEDSTINLGGTKQYTAEVHMKDFGSPWWGSWDNVSAASETTWTSENGSIATVSSTGVVTGKKAGTTTIRAVWKSGPYELTDTATVTVGSGPTSSPTPTPTASPTPTPTPTNSYDFTVTSPVNFRDPITLHPIISTTSCSYQSHTFRVIKGSTWESSVATSRTQDTIIGYPYPVPIGKGTHQVYMDVKTSCGTTTVGPKPLQIVDTGGNQPPFVEIAWFEKGTDTPTHSVLQNTVVDLGIVRYSDPDGDPVIQNNGWDFNRDSFWVRSLPGKYSLNTQWAYRYDALLADIPGNHTVYLTVTDGQGGEYTASTTLQVIDPKPLACIEGPKRIVEKRPLPYPLASCSSSPVNSPIVEESWTNKQDHYDNVGFETVKLKVRDAGGRWSDDASHIIEVIPDMPPLAKLAVPGQSTRGNEITVNSMAASPDGDTIVKHRYEYKYDSSNNGFMDDNWIFIDEGAMTGASIVPDKVGKYLFRETVWEDYGKSDNTDNENQHAYITDVVNLAPVVDVKTSGQTNTPKDISAYGMSDIYDYWNFQSTYGGASNKKNWKLDPNGLQTKTFRSVNYFGTSNYGLGDGKRSYYAGIQGNTVTRTTVTIPITMFSDHSTLYNYEGSSSGLTIKATDKQSLSLKWEMTYNSIPFGNAGHSLSIVDGTLYVFMSSTLTGSQLSAINPIDGTLKWQKSIGISVTNPLYHSINVYPHKDGFVFVALNSGSDSTYVFRMMGTNKEGDTLWSYDWQYQPYALRIVAVAPETGVIYAVPRTTPYDHATESFTMKGYSAATGVELFNTWYGQAASLLGYDDNGNPIFSYASKWFESTYPPRQADIYIGKMNRYGVLSETRKLAIPMDTNSYLYSHQVSATVRAVDKQGRTYITRQYPEYQSEGGGSALDIFAPDGSLIKTVKQYYYNYGSLIMTADGLLTVRSNYIGGGASRIQVLNQNLDVISTFYGGSNGYGLQFLDDQKILSDDQLIDGSANPITYPKAFEAGTPFSDLWFGGSWLSSETVNLNLKPANVSNESIGMVFWVQNALNFYSVEFENGMLRFKRTAGGSSAIIREAAYPIVNNNAYRVKVSRTGNDFAVYVNDIYQFSAAEGWWGGGYLGIVNRGQQGVQFSSMSYESGGGMTGSISGIALVNKPIIYDVDFMDPENDPRLMQAENWMYNHDPGVFMNPEGSWSGSGVSFPSAVGSFPKPGEYTFTFRSKDDPNSTFLHPSMVFDGYRQWSNPVTGKFRVHRPPVAQFTVNVNSDHSLSYLDTSYDPDRYVNDWTYSTEPTGIDYRATRGVMERKWRYKKATDSGYTDGKLLFPPAAGTWDIQLAVKDEYGAWSEWYGQSVMTGGSSRPNSPPVAVLTYPTGTQNTPTQTNVARPTITWNQTDPDPGTEFAAYHVLVKDEEGNGFIDTGTVLQGTTAATQQWVFNRDVVQGHKYQVMVRVNDGQDWSPWSNIGWFGTNRPPEAFLSFPWGTQAVPNVVATTRPTIAWLQADPDSGTSFRMFQVEVANEAGTVILDSGWQWQGTASNQGSWNVSKNLPAGLKLSVRVRVTDNFDAASAWSPPGWLLINRPPVANFDWSPKPLWEGDTVRVVNLSTDPDNDTLRYVWDIRQPDGSSFSSTDTEWSRRWLLTGAYRVTLTANDVHGASSSVTKTIQVDPLTIRSDVAHTSQWLENHEAKGHNTTARPKDFYSGEVFLVETNSSPAPVVEASAWIDAIGMDGSPLYVRTVLTVGSAHTHFTGQLFDERMQSVTEGLPEGIHTVYFRIVYGNGVTKEEEVPIRIIGSIHVFTGVHRMQ